MTELRSTIENTLAKSSRRSVVMQVAGEALRNGEVAFRDE